MLKMIRGRAQVASGSGSGDASAGEDDSAAAGGGGGGGDGGAAGGEGGGEGGKDELMVPYESNVFVSPATDTFSSAFGCAPTAHNAACCSLNFGPFIHLQHTDATRSPHSKYGLPSNHMARITSDCG